MVAFDPGAGALASPGLVEIPAGFLPRPDSRSQPTAGPITRSGIASQRLSAQFGDGYLIGSQSQGATTAKLCPESFTNGTWKALDPGTPTDFVEGEDIGEKLDPPSLYEAQKALRFAREGLVCPP